MLGRLDDQSDVLAEKLDQALPGTLIVREGLASRR
jgi:hypothetical protein